MKILCDTFDLSTIPVIKPRRVSKRKSNPKEILNVDPKRRKYPFQESHLS